MSKVTPEAMAAMDAVEQMGETLALMEDIIKWPELSTEDVAIALSAVLVLGKTGPSVATVALSARVDESAVVALCRRKGSPLVLVGDRLVQPSQALAYGDPA